MTAYVYLNAETGRLVKSSAPPPADITSYEVTEDQDVNLLALADGALIQLPPRPDPYDVPEGTSWIDSRTPHAIRSQDAAALRGERDRRLAATDWTQMPDAPLADADRAAWQAYRQALRDMPATTADLAAPA